jgi:hypothetical protein
MNGRSNAFKTSAIRGSPSILRVYRRHRMTFQFVAVYAVVSFVRAFPADKQNRH